MNVVVCITIVFLLFLGPLMVIVEYCKFGNLSTYLKSKREVFLLNRVSLSVRLSVYLLIFLSY